MVIYQTSMIDNFIINVLDKIKTLCDKGIYCIKESKLPKECRDKNWTKGYNEWKKKHK